MESNDDWSKKESQLRKISSPPFPPPPFLQKPMQGSKFICDLFEYYNKQNVFIRIKVICQTQKPKFFMSNFPCQVMIAQNSREHPQSVNGIYRLCSMLLATGKLFQTTIFDFPYPISDPTQNSMLCCSAHTRVPSYPVAVLICVYICEELKIRSI